MRSLLLIPLLTLTKLLVSPAAAPLNCSVSWVGNSFSGASNRWVQNFFIHTKVQPDGTVNTWSHWDEGGKKFGVYKDGDVIGNTNSKGKTWVDCFHGRIDDVRLYNRALTGEEILKISTTKT